MTKRKILDGYSVNFLWEVTTTGIARNMLQAVGSLFKELIADWLNVAAKLKSVDKIAFHLPCT